MSKSREKDAIQRGDHGPDHVGTVGLFVGGRLLDPFIQYGLLANDWARPLIERLGGSTLPGGPPLLTHTPLDHLGLSPYRTILLGMSVGSMLKHNYHKTVIQREKLGVKMSLVVGIGNMVGNSLNSIFFVCAQTSASANGEHFPQTPLIVGASLFGAGILIEWLSEQQRHAWKKNPANKGRIYQGGLFSLARHINYFGYTLWRTGYALAAGGWTWAAVTASIATYEFTQSAIPMLQDYMQDRYGQKYEQYARAVPYKFIPYVY